jgi:hypothetical protein
MLGLVFESSTGPALGADKSSCICLPVCVWFVQGAEAFHCERCNEKTAATKHLRVHRFPEVLVLHIKRFKYRVRCTGSTHSSTVCSTCSQYRLLWCILLAGPPHLPYLPPPTVLCLNLPVPSGQLSLCLSPQAGRIHG